MNCYLSSRFPALFGFVGVVSRRLGDAGQLLLAPLHVPVVRFVVEVPASQQNKQDKAFIEQVTVVEV